MTDSNRRAVRWVRPSRLVPMAAALSFAAGGCTETLRQTARLGNWSASPDKPIVFSAEPSRDSAALGASDYVLSEHDWQALERIAPRPVWQRLDSAQRRAKRCRATSHPATRRTTGPTTAPIRLADVPTVTLPDGKAQVYYRLRHYGGPTVVSALDGGTQRRKITTTPPNLAGIVGLVTAQLAGKGTVGPLPEENTLVITCEPAVLPAILSLLAGIDVPSPQVEVMARIFEVDPDFDFQFGAHTVLKHLANTNEQSLIGTFSTRAFLESLTDTVSGPYAYQGSVLRLMKVLERCGVTVDATFQALADTGLIKVVAAPRMTVAAGQTACMIAGQELPIQSAKIANDQLVTEKVSYRPVGVQLYVTPQVVGPERVKLHVVTEVSAVSGFAPLPPLEGSMPRQQQALVNPILDSREAETFVTVDNGSTLVVGGMRMIRTVTRERKVPVLGDIQGLEWLFKNHRSQEQINDLYFFVTPRLVEIGA